MPTIGARRVSNLWETISALSLIALGLAACSGSSSPGSPPGSSTAGAGAPAGGNSSTLAVGGRSSGAQTGSSLDAGSSGKPAVGGAAGAASSGGSAGISADPGASSVGCGAESCGAPRSCCQSWSGTAVSGTPSCVAACDETQAQLCGNAADCQQTDTSTCGANGLCVDAGQVLLGNPIGDGGPATGSGPTTAVSDGTIPEGYPSPTAVNYSKCKVVPVSATACAGTPAGNTCIECLFGAAGYANPIDPPGTANAVGQAGNYLVTVELGGAAAGETRLWAESSRGLLAPVSTAAGKKVTYAFAVNVRGMEGQPDHSGAPGGYPELDLFFTDPTATPPAISGIGYALASAATQPIVVYIASDSTTCDQTGGAFGGWGQMLPEFFNAPVEIANYANSGASSASFLGSSALWGGITSHWKAGDYVIIQFGHNDKSATDAEVQANLEKFVAQAKTAKVTPILVSPPARVQFGSGSVNGSQTSLHAASAQAAATKTGVAYIDLTALTNAWYNTLGSQSAGLKYHANGSDATHTNLVGAEKIAGLVAKAIQAQNLPLAQYLRSAALSQ